MAKKHLKKQFRLESLQSGLSDLAAFDARNVRNTDSISKGSSIYSESYKEKDPSEGECEDDMKGDTCIEREMFIQELSYKINELQDSFSQHRDHGALVDREKPITVNGIRITPGTMIFKDAYDGKYYNQTITITNCGKHPVTIRICPPTSKAFKIKPIKIGRTLSSGISLVKKIRFLYTKPTAIPQALMDIYINNDCFRYELLVVTCYSQISVTPKIIDFGEIDVGMVSDVKFLTITNSGTKQAHYSIDLGRNPLEVIVQPLKGTVLPGESKKITIEVFGTTEGQFQQEFWIKADPLQRVHIQGNFIEPTLKIDYPLSDRNFLVLCFPKTFIGVRQQKNVVIKNHSSTSAVFCVMGRTKNDKLPFKNVQEEDINCRQFYIHPMEGSLYPDQQFIMGLSFVPQKSTRHDYYICSVIVDVKKCRVGNAKTPQKIPVTETPGVNNSLLLESISIMTLDEQNEPDQDIKSFNDMITILLYGEVETPRIIIEPNKLCLYNLKVNQPHSQSVKILNKSKTLPLFLKYNKIACVEIVPKTIELPPNELTEAVLTIRPTKMGRMIAKVVFDVFYRQNEQLYKVETVHFPVCYFGEYTENLKLLPKRKPYFVPGITPLVTNEVGYQVDDVRFNSKIDKPIQAIVDKSYVEFDKRNDALIAFPNDRPKCLRPWRNTVPCQTIFAKLPRIVTDFDKDYDLSTSEQILQDTNQSYYKNYIKSLALKEQSKELDESFEDYVTSNEKLLLMQNLKTGKVCPPVIRNINKHVLFVPLTPYELHNLVVMPKFIQLGMLAAKTECSNQFNIENKNGFPVHIAIRPFYPSISILQKQFILAPNSQKNIDFIYHSDSCGTHHMPVAIVMNFFHLFDVTVLAKIVSNTVKCLTKEILIVPTEKTAFLELYNPINSDVKFTVDTTYFHLESFPASGVIPAKKNMICTITFNPEVGCMPSKEIAVISESGAKELIEVRFDRKKATLCLSSECVEFGDIPLNTLVSQELTIKNNSEQFVPVNIEIENNDLFQDIRITPMRALILHKGDLIITFSVKLKEVIQFTLPVTIIFQYEYPRKIIVTGNVVFPDINFTPALIKIPKIPSGAVVKSPFKVANITNIANFMTFPLQDFPEFTIRTKSGENVTDGVTFGPKEKKELYLEFHPQEPVAYCIYFPYSLNGVIGPPELNRPDSLKCDQYLYMEKNEYKTPREITSKLKVMKILCAAGKIWLKFNSLEMKFSSFDETQQEFSVSNIGTSVHEVTFNLKETKYFKFIPNDYNMVMIDNNIKAILVPGETFKINIEFMALHHGTFTAEVPIYVTEYSETIVFNYLKLSGTNPKPKIVPSKKQFYFLPTYIGSKMEQPLTLELLAHKCNGSLQMICDDNHIDIWYLKTETLSPVKTVFYYTIVFGTKQECVIETKIKISCPCSAKSEIDVYACADHSLMINFMADSEIVKYSTYPFFPKSDDTSPYAVLMFTIVPIIERWIYSQGYTYQNYYKIPDSIARYPISVTGKKKTFGGTKAFPNLPLVQLLINLMDRSILKYIDNKIRPTEDIKGRTLYNYVTYRNTISFLKSQEIWVPGLKPEHLLPYVEYEFLKNNFVNSETTPVVEQFSEDEFYRFSKQRWLDLFFRIYKILVLRRVVDPKPVTEDSKQGDTVDNDFVTQDKAEFEKYFRRKVKRFRTWYSCESKLLLWLEYHYNNQKNILWPEENFKDYQLLEQFSDITDSVALATVTAAYCPYLLAQLRDIYASSKKLEHKVHNACRVVQVWKSLKLSIDIHPQSIVKGIKIKLLFIVTYLYEVLPHYYPSNEVTIAAPLSDSSSYELTVTNCGDVAVKYVAIFFGDGKELFGVNNNQILISPKASVKLILTYFAKKMLQASSILVLSGENAGQKYAKTMAVSITGIPKISACTELKINVETYQQVKEKIALQSPYGKNYKAKIFMCFEEPKSYQDFHAISAIKTRNVPREVNVVENTAHFVEKGDTSITLELCFLSQGPTNFYLYFCNSEVGDFCVLVTIISITKAATAENLPVNIPDSFFVAPCSCKRGLSDHCPKVFKIDIPCRNSLLWNCINFLVGRALSDSVSGRLVTGFFGTPLIFRMLKFYLERFPEGFMIPSCIFEDHGDFLISSNQKFSTPMKTLRIPDVTSPDSILLMLHWDNTESIPNEEILELRNTNGKEVRFYKLMFPQRQTSISITADTTNSSKGSKPSTIGSRTKVTSRE